MDDDEGGELMAGRQYATIQSSIWTDDDFRAMSRGAQLCYLQLVSQPALDCVGVQTLAVRRWARQSAGTTEDDVWSALTELQAAGFVLVDDDTCEVLVRSYVRHGCALASPNMRKAIDRTLPTVTSPTLRSAIEAELHRAAPQHYPNPSANGSGNPSANGSGNPSAMGYPIHEHKHVHEHVHETHTRGSEFDAVKVPAVGGRASAIAVGGAFDAFWQVYPRAVGKPKARAAFGKALRRAEADAIIEGARRYAADPNRDDAFTAHPTTWLNRDGWNDPPLPARGRAGPVVSQSTEALLRVAERGRSQP